MYKMYNIFSFLFLNILVNRKNYSLLRTILLLASFFFFSSHNPDEVIDKVQSMSRHSLLSRTRYRQFIR